MRQGFESSSGMKIIQITQMRYLYTLLTLSIITPPRNCGVVTFSLQFVCVCVCVCVCLTLLVNKIPAERMHRFGRGFRSMVAYHTGSVPIEIVDLGSKVKATVT